MNEKNSVKFETQTLVDACHILAAQGHAGGLAGQVSARAAQPGHLWTAALGTGLEECAIERVLLIDPAMQTVAGHGVPNPGIRFHQWIYQRHPHINAIVHTHAPALSALSMLGIPMPVAHMDAAVFFEDCGFLARWPGVPTGDEEGALISAALDGKRSAFLANHGIVCTGSTLQEAVYLKVFAEQNARNCLEALSVGPLAPIEPAAAREAHDFLLQDSIVNGTFDYWTRSARRKLNV